MELRDFGTTFKAYRAEILKDVNLYGELHRWGWHWPRFTELG